MKFFRTMLASMAGFILAFFLLFLIGLITIVTSQRESEPYIRDGSVLKINLQGELPDRPSDDPFEMLFTGQTETPVNLQNLNNSLKKAAADDRISGIWLNASFMNSSWSRLEEARNMIEEFKEESGKFVYASTNDIGLNEQGYYLSSAADSVFAPPETMFQFTGFTASVTFYGGLLEQIGIDVTEVTSGPYKSPGIFSRQEAMDPEDRDQLRAIIDRSSELLTGAVAEKTGMSRSEVDDMLNERPRMRVGFAEEYGLIDEFLYPDAVEDRIMARAEEEGYSRPETVKFSRYNQVSAGSAGYDTYGGSDKIAVLYASGPILPQTSEGVFPGQQQVITANQVLSRIDDIEEDNNVKGVVVRINSPGGSADTSDLIWERLRRLAQEKPVVASMGPVAASGGYYIAAGADSIVASSSTITGSIGVIGTLFNYEQLYEEHLEISVDRVKTHEWADWMAPDRSMTEQEIGFFEDLVDNLYETFLSRVAESRNMSREEVDQLAQGRIWTGEAAERNGLIDEVGDLQKALDLTAEMAGLEAYNTEVFPKPKSLMERLSISAQVRMEQIINPDFPGIDKLRKLEQLEVMARPGGLYLLPYDIEVR